MSTPRLTLVAREDAVVIYWHEELGYYLADWQPVFLRGAKLKRSFQAVIDATRARPGAPWLADASQMPVIDPADQDWITRWYFPEFIRAGGRFQAGVLPEMRIAKTSTLKAVSGVARRGSLELSGHATRAQAEAAILAWLEKHAND
jgi:hypothetical protein